MFFGHQREQLSHHERRVVELEQEIHEHRLYPPEKGAKSRFIQDYMEKEQYLQFEVCIYQSSLAKRLRW